MHESDARSPALKTRVFGFSHACFIFLIVFMASCSRAENCVSYESAPVLGVMYPGISTRALASARIVDLPRGVLARAAGVPCTVAELERFAGVAVGSGGDRVWDALERCLEAKASAVLLGRSGGSPSELDDDAFLEKVVRTASSVPVITPVIARDYYDRNRGWFPGIDFKSLEGYITGAALRDRTVEEFRVLMIEFGKKHALCISLEFVRESIATFLDNPVVATVGRGKPAVVVFSYGCCRPDTMLPAIATMQDEWTSRVDVVHVDSSINHELAARYGATVNPTTFVFSSDGALAMRLLYTWSAAEIQSQMIETGVLQ